MKDNDLIRMIKPSKLYIDQNVVHSKTAIAIREQIDCPYEIVENVQAFYKKLASDSDPVQKGKEILFLTPNKGAFIKKCPGTSDYTCCDYKILHIGTFCTMDCSYCILQSYFHPPVLQYFTNQKDLLKELEVVFNQKTITRIGTGEFTDSFIWEQLSDLTSMLVPMFSKQNNAVLELKTKTTAIQKLEKLQHNRKTIIAWSLNTEKIISQEERRTSSLSARLKASQKCESWGYPIAFHFDPVVIYPGWEEDYKKTIDQMFLHVSPENIVWISIGSFRFIPALKPIIQDRFPESKIIYGEFISGLDGKMRYFKPLRIRLYKKIISYIKEIAPDVVIYFCMEDDEVWEKALGFKPQDKGGLPKMLDESAARHCGLGKVQRL